MAITIKSEWLEGSTLFLRVSGVNGVPKWEKKKLKKGESWTFNPPFAQNVVVLGKSNTEVSTFTAKDNLEYTLKIEVGVGSSVED